MAGYLDLVKRVLNHELFGTVHPTRHFVLKLCKAEVFGVIELLLGHPLISFDPIVRECLVYHGRHALDCLILISHGLPPPHHHDH